MSSYRLNSYMREGPCGLTADQAMGNMAQANAAFSQWAWESAKQEGCLQCPGQRFPSWPPRFVYPQMQKTDTEVLGGCPAAMSSMQSSYAQDALRVLDAYPYSYEGASQYKFPAPAASLAATSTNSSALEQRSAAQVQREAAWLLNSTMQLQKTERPSSSSSHSSMASPYANSSTCSQMR
jgi:hypothetical protein